MSEEVYSDEEEEIGRSFDIPPAVYGIASLIQTIGLVVAGLAALYLLYGLFLGLGGFSSWDPAKQNVMVGNLSIAAKAMMGGLAVASVCAVLLYWFIDTAGYIILGLAALFWFGLPLAFTAFGSGLPSRGIDTALAAFPAAALVPAAMGGILALKDVFLRFVRAVRGRDFDSSKLVLGANAEQEAKKPIRTSLLGKCWEGSYCRDWVRPHCPVYQKRAACWQGKRGCYCEEEIISNAAQRVQGVQLEMAPASQLNFANPAQNSRRVNLTPAQKIQRCKNCVIYNDHQAEKYKILMPLTIVGVVALCALFSPVMHSGISAGMMTIEALANRLSFNGTRDSAVKIPPMGVTAQWAIVGALSLMIVSKALQVLEWCIFTKKI
jgi:hypothetical protein